MSDFVCPCCGRVGLPSKEVGGVCTGCANRQRGISFHDGEIEVVRLFHEDNGVYESSTYYVFGPGMVSVGGRRVSSLPPEAG